MMRATVKFLFILMLLFLPGFILAETMILEGRHRVVLDIINPSGIKKIPDYQNANFSQKVIETKPWTARVEIIIALEPFRSQAAYPLADYQVPEQFQVFLKPEAEVQSSRPEIQQLARELVGYASTETDAVTRVDWNGPTDMDWYRPVDAIEVLQDGDLAFSFNGPDWIYNGQRFTKRDILRYDFDTETYSLFLRLPGLPATSNLTGLELPNDDTNLVLFNLTTPATLNGQSFQWYDIIQWTPAQG